MTETATSQGFEALAETDDGAAVLEELQQGLGERLVAVYAFGSAFARGQGGPRSRRLVLIDRVDAPALELLSPIVARARDQGSHLRIDTAPAILRGADCFPIFTLELLDTRRLIYGADVLVDLAMPRSHLRLHLEQSLRRLHRDLLEAFVKDKAEDLPRDLRGIIRRSVYLLRTLALMLELPLPEKPGVEELINTVIPAALSAEDLSLWQHLRAFASFRLRPGPHEIIALADEALRSIDALIERVDTHPEPKAAQPEDNKA